MHKVVVLIFKPRKLFCIFYVYAKTYLDKFSKSLYMKLKLVFIFLIIQFLPPKIFQKMSSRSFEKNHVKKIYFQEKNIIFRKTIKKFFYKKKKFWDAIE